MCSLFLLSTSLSYNNFSHFCKFIFIKRSFTNYLYIISFIHVVYSTYFLHILLLQHGDIETNPRPQKEKKKNLSFCHWNVNSLIAHILYKLTYLEAYSSVYKHDFICISETFFGSSVQEEDKNIQLDSNNLFGAEQIMVFASFTKKLLVFILQGQGFPQVSRMWGGRALQNLIKGGGGQRQYMGGRMEGLKWC